ncbi:DUF4129 domain-containing protein [Herpetosiphon llansteffanensis]
MINRQSAKLLILLSACIAYSSLMSLVLNSFDIVGDNASAVWRWPVFCLGLIVMVSLRLRLRQRGAIIVAAGAIGLSMLGWLWLRTEFSGQELVLSGFGVSFLMSRAINADQWNHDWLQQLFWRGLFLLVAFVALGPVMTRGALEEAGFIQLFLAQALGFVAACLFAMMLDQSNQTELQTPPMLGWSSLFTLLIIGIPLLLFGLVDGQRSIVGLIFSTFIDGLVLIVGGIGIGLSWLVGLLIPSFTPNQRPPEQLVMPEAVDPSTLKPEETSKISSLLGDFLTISVALIGVLMICWLIYLVVRWLRDVETRAVVPGEIVIEQSIWSFDSLREQILERFRRKKPWKFGADDPQRQKVRRVYTKFLELGEDHGQPRGKHQTAHEYGRGYAQRQPNSEPAIDELTAIYTQARYATELDPAALERAEQALKNIQKNQT